MSEFQELIKNIDKCRDYVRDFFVYGFKSRSDFPGKSARTYDDERRRIVSWLEGYISEDLTQGGRSKNISLQIDQKLLETNPLFRVWQAASFTDRDLILHFYILKILEDKGEAYSAPQLSEILIDRYGINADWQIVRRKCNEYVDEGLLTSYKEGKSLKYRRGILYGELMEETESLTDMIKCFALDLPLGYVGHTILSMQDEGNTFFGVKHSFPTFTLEDEILLSLLEAIHDKRKVKLRIQSNRRMHEAFDVTGIPLQIFVSTRTGRRFVCLCNTDRRSSFDCMRLDQIKEVKLLEQADEQEEKKQRAYLEKDKEYIWGVSFRPLVRGKGRLQKLILTVSADEHTESFIVQRLIREGEGGSVEKIADNTFRYEKTVVDAIEMFPWIRTFTGRIVELKIYGSNGNTLSEENTVLEKMFYDDLERSFDIYGI